MQALNNDQLRRIAPSIFATQADDRCSERYRFVPTIEVIEALRGEGFYPVSVKASKARTEEGAEYVKHSLRLRREADMSRKLTRFGQILPELALTNSHNGTSGFNLDAALLRLVCTNGLIANSGGQTLRYRHSGRDDLVGRVIEGAYSIVENFPLISEKIEAWSDVMLTQEQRMAFARAAAPLRFDTDVPPQLLLAHRRFGDDRPDLFSTMNVIQENMIRGGIALPRTPTGRRSSSRPITSVDKDLKLNRALWQLAEKMSKLVS